MRSSSNRPRRNALPTKTAARHFNWQRLPREIDLYSLATGLLEELRIAQFFHKWSRALPWSGVEGADSPLVGFGATPQSQEMRCLRRIAIAPSAAAAERSHAVDLPSRDCPGTEQEQPGSQSPDGFARSFASHASYAVFGDVPHATGSSPNEHCPSSSKTHAHAVFVAQADPSTVTFGARSVSASIRVTSRSHAALQSAPSPPITQRASSARSKHELGSSPSRTHAPSAASATTAKKGSPVVLTWVPGGASAALQSQARCFSSSHGSAALGRLTSIHAARPLAGGFWGCFAGSAKKDAVIVHCEAQSDAVQGGGCGSVAKARGATRDRNETTKNASEVRMIMDRCYRTSGSRATAWRSGFAFNVEDVWREINGRPAVPRAELRGPRRSRRSLPRRAAGADGFALPCSTPPPR